MRPGSARSHYIINLISYLPPRKNEINAPSTPINARAKMTKPNGTLGVVVDELPNDRVARGGGAVNVGRRVTVV